MFGNASKPSRIYAYKARRATLGIDRINDQIFLSHRYRNRLVEIERTRREEIEIALRESAPEVADLAEQLDQAMTEVERITAEIKVKNAILRKKSATAEDRANLAAAKAIRKDLSGRLKVARKTAFADPQIKEAIANPSTMAEIARKQARRESQLYWGSYLRIEQSLMGCGQGPPPRFQSWNREGAIAVQIQGGMDWSDALAALDLRFRIVVRPPSADANPESRRSRETPMADAWVRVGSDAGKPIWAVVPFRLFRQPPEDARIKWVILHRMIVGTHEYWELQLTLEREDWEKPDNATCGQAGIDVNWRVFPEGLRVATLVGFDGRLRHLFLPRSLMEGFAKSESLQSIRDRHFDAIRSKLTEWITDAKADRGFTEEFTRQFTFLAQWKSVDRLARSIWWWKDHRQPGDETIWDQVWAWRQQDCHLHDWQDHQRRKTARKRDELYRRFAAIVRRHYKTVVIEDTNWADLARLPGPDEPSDAATREYSRVASVGKLLRYLKEAVTEVVKVEAKNTTRTCHACDYLNTFDQARNLIHTCDGCGTTWDQDVNAARNLLATIEGQIEVEVEVA